MPSPGTCRGPIKFPLNPPTVVKRVNDGISETVGVKERSEARGRVGNGESGESTEEDDVA